MRDNELFQHMSKQKDLRAFRDWQIITAVQTHTGKKAEEIASVLGVSINKVYHVLQKSFITVCNVITFCKSM
ncbi:hypothetical protein EZS27_007530 [termite gut metagenome]|uniref:HTH luxR-type domain-containing protein n=1 Tax=termite gut metagenome TaxID=433724 RepID=A0A5J4SFD5_9ZZZZ